MEDSKGTGARTRVLIVDDHPIARYGVARLLEATGDLSICAEAADARAAYHAMKRHRPQLVLIDIALRDGGGIETIRRLRSANGEAPVLVITSRHESVFAERALRAGAAGFLDKRSDVSEILAAVRRVLAGDLAVSESISGRLLNRFVQGDGRRCGMEALSDRELEVFELIGQGHTTREIAERLHLSIKTIETYRENAKVKLDLRSSVELIREAVQWTIAD
jgi:DNA-binding NarL/FixJ family response regulator